MKPMPLFGEREPSQPGRLKLGSRSGEICSLSQESGKCSRERRSTEEEGDLAMRT